MVHKRLQIDYREGSIEIQFNVKYNGQNTSIETIQIHSNFPETHLPWFNKENPKVSKGECTIDISWLSNYFNDPSRFLGAKLNSNSKITFSIIDVHNARKIEYSGEIISKKEIKLHTRNYVKLPETIAS